VRLHLEADWVSLIEADHARIVLEDAHAPIIRPSRRRISCVHQDRLLEQVVDPPAVKVDLALEGLVRTVFDQVCQRLQLDVGRITTQRLKVSLDGPHLSQAQRELALPADLLELRRRSAARNGTVISRKLYGLPSVRCRGRAVLSTICSRRHSPDPTECRRAEDGRFGCDVVAAEGADRVETDAEVVCGIEDTLTAGSITPGNGKTVHLVDQSQPAVVKSGAARFRREDDEELVEQALHPFARQIASRR